MERLMNYEGKKVYIILKNKRKYHGVVVEIIFLGGEHYLLTILDKYNKYVSFDITEIELIQEEGKG